MTMRGPKPQTAAQKRAKGESRPCRLNTAEVLEFPVVDNVPDPPEWLNEDGQALWHDVAPALHRQRVLTKADM